MGAHGDRDVPRGPELLLGRRLRRRAHPGNARRRSRARHLRFGRRECEEPDGRAQPGRRVGRHSAEPRFGATGIERQLWRHHRLPTSPPRRSRRTTAPATSTSPSTAHRTTSIISDGSGDITVAVPANVSYSVVAKAASGSSEHQRAHKPLIPQRHSPERRLGGHKRGPLRLLEALGAGADRYRYQREPSRRDRPRLRRAHPNLGASPALLGVVRVPRLCHSIAVCHEPRSRPADPENRRTAPRNAGPRRETGPSGRTVRPRGGFLSDRRTRLGPSASPSSASPSSASPSSASPSSASPRSSPRTSSAVKGETVRTWGGERGFAP